MFPVLSKLIGKTPGAPIMNGPSQGSLPPGSAIQTAAEDIACDVTTLAGPMACLHNEHNKILHNQQVTAGKIDATASRLEDAHRKVDLQTDSLRLAHEKLNHVISNQENLGRAVDEIRARMDQHFPTIQEKLNEILAKLPRNV